MGQALAVLQGPPRSPGVFYPEWGSVCAGSLGTALRNQGQGRPLLQPSQVPVHPVGRALGSLAQRELQVRAAPGAADAALALRRGQTVNVQTLGALSKKGNFICLRMSPGICT